MPDPTVLLLRTAGTNCDEETQFAFEKAGATVTPVHVRALCEDPETLKSFTILALPGGFSYGDDLGSGVVLANEMNQRLREPLARFVEDGGLVIGICNGFQVLVKTGLLPGKTYRAMRPDPMSVTEATTDRKPSSLPATLTFNDSRRFEDRWVRLKVEDNASPFLAGRRGEVVTFPVAHGEGKFVTRDSDTLTRLVESNQIAFRYVSRPEEQLENKATPYPDNPNGSAADIAGITDETGRVLGLMPHPERHVLPWQHPRWTRSGLPEEGDGLFLFRNAVEYVRGDV